MVIRVVVLDLDMTLADTLPTFFRVLITCAGKRGIELRASVDEMMRIYYSDPSLSPLLNGLARDFQFWRECWLNYVKQGQWGIVYRGAVDTIRWLRNVGKHVTIATGRELECKAFVEELKHYGFLDLIEYCISLGDLGPGHDKKDLIINILSRYHVEPHSLLYVTDHPRDILITRDLGIISVGVATYAKDFPTRYVIKGIWELPNVIKMIDEGTYSRQSL